MVLATHATASSRSYRSGDISTEGVRNVLLRTFNSTINVSIVTDGDARCS
jgi:hypothetical protein